jgi:hypothetical protein
MTMPSSFVISFAVIFSAILHLHLRPAIWAIRRFKFRTKKLTSANGALNRVYRRRNSNPLAPLRQLRLQRLNRIGGIIHQLIT